MKDLKKRIMRRCDIRDILLIGFVVLIFVALIGIVSFEIYLWVKYGNMPHDEIPAWVWWFML